MITLADDSRDLRQNAFMQVLGLSLFLYALLALFPAYLELTPVAAMPVIPHPDIDFPVGPADAEVAERYGRLDHSGLHSVLLDAAPNPSPAAIAAYDVAQP
jgi:hypothetical protein